ncbi:hypothetical protein AVM02_07475 [Brucella anthropi]|uniref:hypothetical protein n=1 Tax=Brucella anthropi TaxID=529 RepID=UPI0039868B53
MASLLKTFTQYNIDNTKPERLVAVDPKKVTFVRQTAHGSTFIGYTKDFGFDVSQTLSVVVETLNAGRGL